MAPGNAEDWSRKGSELEGKVAIVTGAAKGIGRGIALVLGEQGATVVVSDLDLEGAESTAAEIAELGVEAAAMRHDVADPADSVRVVDQTVERFGKLDVLVNNAGVVKAEPIWEITEAEFDRQVTVNQKGLFFATQAALAPMRDQRSGVVINISSQAGLKAEPLYSTYSMTKWAAISMAQSISEELSRENIRACAVCPGVVRTPLWDNNLAELSVAKGISQEEAFEEFIESIPLHRAQSTRDIGEAVSFLASDRAHNVTGVALSVTGGRALH